MKILIIHRNFFVDGGDSNYAIKLANLLKSKGHQVSIFTIADKRNLKNDFKVYEIPNVFSKSKNTRISELNLFSKIKYGINSIFSIGAYYSLKKLLKKEKFDLIHLQSIHHIITPSILISIKKAEIPVVWTLHDYKLVCPSSNYFTKGSICEKCNGGKYYHSLFNRCKRNSIWGSFIIMVSAYLEKIMKLYNTINLFITPSNFLRQKLIQNGFPENKVINIPNYIDKVKLVDSKNDKEEFILYYGNLSKEKGVDVLLKVVSKLSTIPFLFIGDGPLYNNVLEASKKNSNITLIEFLDKTQLFEKIKNSKFVVIPSQWYENFPFTVLEPISLGKTVIASEIGGIPEIIKNDFNGLLVSNPASLEEWVTKINDLFYDKNKIQLLESNAIESVKQYSIKNHITIINNLYKELINNNDHGRIK